MSDHKDLEILEENKEIFLSDILAGNSDFIRTNDEIEFLNRYALR